MNCLIPGSNMKVLNKALNSLHKISDEAFLECTVDCFSLLAMNMNKTTYARFNFRPVFFTAYEVVGNVRTIKANVHLRALQIVFKQKMERKVELCKIELANDADSVKFTLTYKRDVKMVHTLKLIDIQYLTLNYNRDDCANLVVGNGQFFLDILANFLLSDSCITFEVGKDRIVFRNYDTSISSIYKGMKSQISVEGSEFLSFSIGEETNLVFSLKSFRAALTFAEQFDLSLNLYFDGGGCPMIIVMRNPTFDVDFVISTVNPNEMSQSSGSTTSSAPVLELRNNSTLNKQNVTLQNTQRQDESQVRGSFSKVLEKIHDETDENAREVRARVFARCFDPTFHTSMLNLGETLFTASDSDDEG